MLQKKNMNMIKKFYFSMDEQCEYLKLKLLQSLKNNLIFFICIFVGMLNFLGLINY